jgi:RHS repeat-associated protein
VHYDQPLPSGIFSRPPANTTNSSGSLTNFFRYTAREFDTETNLYYNRARYLDPSTGRFFSEDPISFGGGLNFYQYARSNPINFFDPSGLDVEALCEPIQQYHLGFIFGAVHCRLHKKYDGLNETLELPGPGQLHDEPFDPARPGYPLPVKRPPDGGGCNNFEKCIDKQYDFYKSNPQDLPTYNAVNSNSNAFILNLVRSCGGDIPYNEFHYVSPFNWYHFYGQMPDK